MDAANMDASARPPGNATVTNDHVDLFRALAPAVSRMAPNWRWATPAQVAQMGLESDNDGALRDDPLADPELAGRRPEPGHMHAGPARPHDEAGRARRLRGEGGGFERQGLRVSLFVTQILSTVFLAL